MRDELFTTKVVLDNRSYFFNVKENRMGDVFLQVVESKSRNGEDFDRRAIVVFADDMQRFCQGLDESLSFIAKNQKERSKSTGKRIVRKKPQDDSPRRTGDSGDTMLGEDTEHYESPVKRTGKVLVVKKKE
jgi:hypothetical protein